MNYKFICLLLTSSTTADGGKAIVYRTEAVREVPALASRERWEERKLKA